MEGIFDVTASGVIAGSVEVQRRGLYYRFQCRCRFDSEEIRRLMVSMGDETAALGVLVPEGDGFVLDKNIPVKNFSDGDPQFFVSGGDREDSGFFVPLCPEEPFAYLSRLTDAFITQRQGKTGLWIRGDREARDQRISSVNPTGQ